MSDAIIILSIFGFLGGLAVGSVIVHLAIHHTIDALYKNDKDKEA